MGCTCTKSNNQIGGYTNNGECATCGCNKMNAFNWLSNMEILVEERFDIVEICFKNGWNIFFKNEHRLDLTTGDAVIIKAKHGYPMATPRYMAN